MSDQHTTNNQAKPVSRLPDLPSELLELALKHLRYYHNKSTQDEDPTIEIEMSYWLTAPTVTARDDDFDFNSGTCYACLAGSAMLGEFKQECRLAMLDEYKETIIDDADCEYFDALEISPGNLLNYGVSESDTQKLYALNAFRAGFISDAYGLMDRQRPDAIGSYMAIEKYEQDSDAFFRNMEQLIEYLRNCGE